MKLWTVWVDYSATGEGRSLMARISHAENAQDALEAFGEEFDAYFARGAQAVEGVLKNKVTQALFSSAAFTQARHLEGRATFELTARCHYNLS